VLSLSVTDEVGASCVDAVHFIVGRPPMVAISAPVDGGLVNQDETVSFLGTATDADTEASGLDVRWSSDRDGDFFLGAPDSVGLTHTTYSSLSVGVHAISLTATDPLGLTATAVVILQVNGLPTAPVVRITPDPATTTDTLSVVFDGVSVDAEADPVTYRYEWFSDGVLVSDLGTVAASQTAKHQHWSVRVTPSDGHGDGVFAVADRVIDNTLPIISVVSIEPDPVFTDTVVSALISAEDPDGDVIIFEHIWSVDGGVVAETSGDLDGVSWFDKHAVLGLSVWPFDDDGGGDIAVASAVVVQNSPPTAAEISIGPDEAVGGRDDLVCSVDGSATDADGDPILYTVDWERDGDEYPDDAPADTGLAWTGPFTDVLTGDTVPGLDTRPEELWQCAVTSWDDEEAGGTATAERLMVAPPPGCGDGVLQAGEEYEPPPGPFSSISVDPETCRWDFSEVEQLYCYGFCSWAGPPGCDQADADVLCKLTTDNPDSVALSYTITAPLSTPGFPGVYCGYGTVIDTDRGVEDVSWMDASMAAHHGGGGEVVAFPVCSD
jgi:hypothetical protein